MAKISTSIASNVKRAAEAFARLERAYPDARCSLDFNNPLELLVATILAAQCTDVRVNQVTKSLFKKYRKPEDYASAPQTELEKAIQSCGFYRNKAKNIKSMSQALLDKHNGEVPCTLKELVVLDGVGRKTANVVLGEFFEPEGVVVDTHCTRLSRRLGFTKHTDPVKIERDLMKILPREHYRMFSHYLVFHGRAVCAARAPKCSQCVLHDLCPFKDSAEGKKIRR